MKSSEEGKRQICDICRDFNLCDDCKKCDFKEFIYDAKAHVYFKFDKNYCRTDVCAKSGTIKKISPLGHVTVINN